MARKDRTGNRKTRDQRPVRRVPEMGYYLVVTDTEATERCFFTGLHDSYRAKNVYINHLKNADRFKCTSDYPNADDPQPLTFKITGQGLSIKSVSSVTYQYNSFNQKSYGGK